MKVPELRLRLKARELPTEGLKAELVSRLLAACGVGDETPAVEPAEPPATPAAAPAADAPTPRRSTRLNRA